MQASQNRTDLPCHAYNPHWQHAILGISHLYLVNTREHTATDSLRVARSGFSTSDGDDVTLGYHTWLLAIALVSIPAFIVVCVYSYVERKRAQDESWTGKPIILSVAGHSKAGAPAVFAQRMKKVKDWVGGSPSLNKSNFNRKYLLAQGPGTPCVHMGRVWRRVCENQSLALRWPHGNASRFIENKRWDRSCTRNSEYWWCS